MKVLKLFICAFIALQICVTAESSMFAQKKENDPKLHYMTKKDTAAFFVVVNDVYFYTKFDDEFQQKMGIDMKEDVEDIRFSIDPNEITKFANKVDSTLKDTKAIVRLTLKEHKKLPKEYINK